MNAPESYVPDRRQGRSLAPLYERADDPSIERILVDDRHISARGLLHV